MQEEKNGVIQVPSSTQLSMLLGQSLVLVNSIEYENLKKENHYLKGRVSELEHNGDMFRQKIETDKQTIEELKKENDNLKRKIELLEKELEEHRIKLAEQNTRIMSLENENHIRKNKEFVKKLVIGLQDLNSYYRLENELRQPYKTNLTKMRENRNDDCHILGIRFSGVRATTEPVLTGEASGRDPNESRVSEVQKAWRYLISKSSPEVRTMLDSKCGKGTVDEVVTYLVSICQDSSSPADENLVDWFSD